MMRVSTRSPHHRRKTRKSVDRLSAISALIRVSNVDSLALAPSWVHDSVLECRGWGLVRLSSPSERAALARGADLSCTPRACCADGRFLWQ